MAVAVFICWFGFYIVQPNQGKVMQFFGSYVGTDRNAGLRWANPLYSKQSISLRVRNFESGRLKVNDANGNPIEIALKLKDEVHDRLQKAGVEVLEARLSHLAYAQEIAQAMVSNLLVVLCGDSNAKPAINTGSIY